MYIARLKHILKELIALQDELMMEALLVEHDGPNRWNDAYNKLEETMHPLIKILEFSEEKLKREAEQKEADDTNTEGGN